MGRQQPGCPCCWWPAWRLGAPQPHLVSACQALFPAPTPGGRNCTLRLCAVRQELEVLLNRSLLLTVDQPSSIAMVRRIKSPSAGRQAERTTTSDIRTHFLRCE